MTSVNADNLNLLKKPIFMFYYKRKEMTQYACAALKTFNFEIQTLTGGGKTYFHTNNWIKNYVT